ncbi:MAG: hypothetical protein L0206_21580 [Actinobacteria bacterium]|nr:hypothetical protein [Actinomycetota bacterium]
MATGIPLVGHSDRLPIACPGAAPHIEQREGEDVVCRYCGGYGIVLVNPRAIKILDIRDGAPAVRSNEET